MRGCQNQKKRIELRSCRILKIEGTNEYAFLKITIKTNFQLWKCIIDGKLGKFCQVHFLTNKQIEGVILTNRSK